tara:strand:- start:2071 stop:2319 length:249 start_codon:yes stop_codon:yes gene_type:complete
MSYSRKDRKASVSGIYVGPTVSNSSPKNSRRGCLCLDRNIYDVSCCKGYMQNQGIGKIQSVIVEHGAFSSGFDNGFDIEIIR